MTATGALFTGLSEASGGGTNNSPSNLPFVVLQSLANDQVRYLRPDPAMPWTASTYKSLNIPTLNQGYALMTVIVNGIPSPSAIIQINNPSGITPVRLAEFAARRDGAGVLIEWNALSEIQNVGFNLYRRDARSAEWTRVNASLIAGRLTSAEPKMYRVLDWPQPGEYAYRIESVSLAGEREAHSELAGPVVLDWNDCYKDLRPVIEPGAAHASKRVDG